jgi:hypothetical protein
MQEFLQNLYQNSTFDSWWFYFEYLQPYYNHDNDDDDDHQKNFIFHIR